MNAINKMNNLIINTLLSNREYWHDSREIKTPAKKMC